MPSINSATLSRNAFSGFPTGATGQLVHLEHLSMDYNNLDTVSTNDFADAEHLRSLTMGNNNIVHLEIVVFTTHYEAPNVKPCILFSLTLNQASQWRQLVQLDLSYNRITKLPEDFCELANLEDLDLTSNWLKELPVSIGKLTRLVKLNLEFNHITHLPKSIGELENLRVLNLDANRLTRIPCAIGNLHNLTSLKLEDNMIQRLPTQIGDLKQLTRLCLKNNKPLDQLPVELAALPLLSFLSLEGCNLRQIPGDIVQAGAGAVIKFLFPGDLKQLTRLCLKNNKPLDQLPVELAALPLLSFLSLEGCNLRQIPGDIVQAGAGAVIK
ncbi:hypothetical protein T265_14500, partial [Opisthorchis viverrini]